MMFESFPLSKISTRAKDLYSETNSRFFRQGLSQVATQMSCLKEISQRSLKEVRFNIKGDLEP